MATSGTYIFNPDLAAMVDEAFERCKVDPANITIRHVLSARRSIHFMLSYWATKDFNDFRIQRLSFPVVQGQAEYTGPTDIPPEVIDITSVMLTRNGVDTPVTFMSRSEHFAIPVKTTEGRPDRIFIDKQRDNIVATLWTVPENSTDVITYDALVRFEDSIKASQNADIPYYLHDAFVSGLAYRLGAKFAPLELMGPLYQIAESTLKDAMDSSREKGDVRIIPVPNRPRGRGRRR